MRKYKKCTTKWWFFIIWVDPKRFLRPGGLTNETRFAQKEYFLYF